MKRLRYVGNTKFLPEAEKLLADRAPALRIGIVRHPRYRRVCDQAVDTVVFLRRLQVSFPVGPGEIYTDEEIAKVRALAH